VSDEEAAWFGLAAIVQNGVRRAEHTLGDSAVVIGLGPLGQLVTQYLRVLGCWNIIAVDTAPARLEWARKHGATHTLQIDVATARETVREITEGRGADVVYDVTGHPAVLAPALTLPRNFGKVILLGDTGTPSQQHLTVDVVTRGLQIIGAHDGNPPLHVNDHLFWTHRNMIRLFFEYVSRKQMNVADLVTHRYKPQQAPEAYELLRTSRDQAMGVMFDWAE
jgi:threonine dehydrogenase-like Zn-dependent dehydrogenase